MTNPSKPYTFACRTSQRNSQSLQKSMSSNRTEKAVLDGQIRTEKEERTHNSGFKKLAVQCLNEALYFISRLVVHTVLRFEIRFFDK